MDSNVISLRTRRAQPAAERRGNGRFVRVKAQTKLREQVPSDKLVCLTKALIVRLREARFNQRPAVYRELDAIARLIEHEAGAAPGSWI